MKERADGTPYDLSGKKDTKSMIYMMDDTCECSLVGTQIASEEPIIANSSFQFQPWLSLE